ncbi:sugar transferase [Leptolyngbya sp. FACHB-36]|uniref:sugar transferase n=1 Tax=Leptolyngbya sp. FACHB-36 TaxID=2692808 RepID=UPI001681436B|nr:sugar transferase [Leptolyngbya sp. FACHB-36]MBD2021529.1 sugar transferase [Leptolyngbya sp. FACHB-36]
MKPTISASTDVPVSSEPSLSTLKYFSKFSEITPTQAAIPHVASVHCSAISRTKRLIDIAGAIVGLTITAVVVVPVAIAIQLNDPGPVFYSQIRCGLQGKAFRIWKFRSMVTNADKLKHLVHNEASGGIFKNRNDPRVTPIGRLLRRTSLDELPQFWNVLIGDMSLVGTRPPTVDEVFSYKRHHWKRLNVKPGITGEWQANGRSSVTDFEEIVRMDIAYQTKWSIAYDLHLILKTIQAVLLKKGAF